MMLCGIPFGVWGASRGEDAQREQQERTEGASPELPLPYAHFSILSGLVEVYCQGPSRGLDMQ